jgi:hypothetical protein
MLELENKIREALPRLSKIEKGQRFLSKYYGVITATQIDDFGNGNYGIYGFDELEGLPRSNYYPRDLEIIGHPIKLNDILEWCSLKTTNFFIEDSKAYFAINYGNKNEQRFYWNLSSVFLADQSEELIKFLDEL